jgi:hypothetical protein
MEMLMWSVPVSMTSAKSCRTRFARAIFVASGNVAVNLETQMQHPASVGWAVIEVK